LYLRVSSKEQTTDNQLQPLEQFCKSRGFEIVKVYAESESDWRIGHQRELARLLNDVRSGKRKYDIVLVWALDRLSRGVSAAILNLVDTFKTYGVKVVSYQESWTETPGVAGEILYAVAGWVARMESERRSERTLAGLARVKAQGVKLGRPKGSKDKETRRHAGYLNRWIKEKGVKENAGQV
jgi:DNA invertase Pin-like site-specific DNA recombinase